MFPARAVDNIAAAGIPPTQAGKVKQMSQKSQQKQQGEIPGKGSDGGVPDE